MSGPRDTKEVKRHILGYGYMLSEFKRLHPDIILKQVSVDDPPLERTVEQTERPTIDVSDYDKKPGIAFHSNSEGFSFFRAEPGFRPKHKVPSGRKVVSYIDIDGLIRYIYGD